VTPAIGVRIDPQARILPLDVGPLPVNVTIHAEGPAEGTVSLKLPHGWRSKPAEAHFHLDAGGDSEPIPFSVTPVKTEAGAYTIQAVAHSAGHTYQTGWQSVGYPGLRPYNLYKSAQLLTRKVDVKLASGLRVGYVMGTGDLVPEAIEALGVAPTCSPPPNSPPPTSPRGTSSSSASAPTPPSRTHPRPAASPAVCPARRNPPRPLPERQLPRPVPALHGPHG